MLSTKKLLWLDIETTGLNPAKGEILEIALVVTNLDLEIIDALNIVIDPQKDYDCDAYVTKMHTDNGLFRAVKDHGVCYQTAQKALMLFVATHFTPTDKPELHGNTVHFDKKWLEHHMPPLAALFAYRIVDVSSFKVVVQNYLPALAAVLKGRATTATAAHRALADIGASIKEFKTYLELAKIKPRYSIKNV
jgi:oligoribonuclease